MVDQIASADFLIKLNKEKREKGEKKESQWLHLSYLIKVPAEINIEKSSVLAFFLLNLIFGWCVTLVSTSRAAASTSTMSPKHLRRSFQHLRACQILISQRTFFVYQNINVIKVQRKAHMHPRMLSPFGYICMTARPTFIPFGSAELSSGLEIVPGPCRPSMSTWTTDERLLGAGEKMFPICVDPPHLFRLLERWCDERIISLHQIQSTPGRRPRWCVSVVLMQPSCCWNCVKTPLWTHNRMLNLHEHGSWLSPQKS